ncbi:MAG: hypothetical protein KME11_06270 [Timaviella obliquedivisa GSE-PSE-MK23-08B]|nr:hypothetical protein [Timaviella obliquedivisa GSE-PSE-MK23-08B]
MVVLLELVQPELRYAEWGGNAMEFRTRSACGRNPTISGQPIQQTELQKFRLGIKKIRPALIFIFPAIALHAKLPLPQIVLPRIF